MESTAGANEPRAQSHLRPLERFILVPDDRRHALVRSDAHEHPTDELAVDLPRGGGEAQGRSLHAGCRSGSKAPAPAPRSRAAARSAAGSLPKWTGAPISWSSAGHEGCRVTMDSRCQLGAREVCCQEQHSAEQEKQRLEPRIWCRLHSRCPRQQNLHQRGLSQTTALLQGWVGCWKAAEVVREAGVVTEHAL